MTNIKRKVIKIVTALLVMQIIFAVENVSKAGIWDDIFNGGQTFFNIGKDAANQGYIDVEQGDGNKVTISTPSASNIKAVTDRIYMVLFPLGIAVTVIIGGALGIKFMIASAEDKAKLKESLVPFGIGCIVIYGAFGIWKLCIEVFSTVF